MTAQNDRSSPIPWSDSDEDTPDDSRTARKTPRTSDFASPGKGGPASAFKKLVMNTPSKTPQRRRQIVDDEEADDDDVDDKPTPIPRPNFGIIPPTPQTPHVRAMGVSADFFTTPRTPQTPGRESDKPVDIVKDVFVLLKKNGVELEEEKADELRNLLSRAQMKTQGYLKAYVSSCPSIRSLFITISIPLTIKTRDTIQSRDIARQTIKSREQMISQLQQNKETLEIELRLVKVSRDSVRSDCEGYKAQIKELQKQLEDEDDEDYGI